MASSDQILLLLLLLSISTLSAAATSPPSTPPLAGGCSNQVVAFSPCLQFISLPPNNRTAAPSAACCDEYSAAVRNGSAACLCYMVRRPLLLGFPLSTARILSLSSLCPLPDSGGSAANSSLESFCSGSSALPPLGAITGPGIPRLPLFGGLRPRDDSPPSPQNTAISPPEVADGDTLPTELNLSIITPTSSSFKPTNIRSAAERIRNKFIISFTLLIPILVPISTLHLDTPLYLVFVNQVGYRFTRIKQSCNK